MFLPPWNPLTPSVNYSLIMSKIKKKEKKWHCAGEVENRVMWAIHPRRWRTENDDSLTITDPRALSVIVAHSLGRFKKRICLTIMQRRRPKFHATSAINRNTNAEIKTELSRFLIRRNPPRALHRRSQAPEDTRHRSLKKKKKHPSRLKRANLLLSHLKRESQWGVMAFTPWENVVLCSQRMDDVLEKKSSQHLIWLWQDVVLRRSRLKLAVGTWVYVTVEMKRAASHLMPL